jgi:hypothetical protein
MSLLEETVLLAAVTIGCACATILVTALVATFWARQTARAVWKECTPELTWAAVLGLLVQLAELVWGVVEPNDYFPREIAWPFLLLSLGLLAKASLPVSRSVFSALREKKAQQQQLAAKN